MYRQLRGMSASPTRPVRLPPTDLANHPLPRTRQIARAWYRVHPSSDDAIYFSLLPTHRFSHPNCPYKFLYLTIDAQTCLWERFGDLMFDGAHALPKTHWDDASISAIQVPPLHLCGLVQYQYSKRAYCGLNRALMSDDITVPQQWGLAIQNHPSQVGEVLPHVVGGQQRGISIDGGRFTGKFPQLLRGQRIEAEKNQRVPAEQPEQANQPVGSSFVFAAN